jgi:sorting nexin-41/42
MMQSEVTNSPPLSLIPKSIYKAPPLKPWDPSEAHNYLLVPGSGAKLKVPVGGQMHIDPDAMAGGAQVSARFPADSKKLSEQELDPYFINFELSIKDLEQHLKGPMEQTNRRLITHLRSLATDLYELGSRYNAFALTDHSMERAVERVGQAADNSYVATSELYATLEASFAEPMRENAQFASVVRSVLRFRDLKRVQQDMVNEEFAKRKRLLGQLEASEAEARRIDQYLSSSQIQASPRRASTSAGEPTRHQREGSEDAESIDSDFPPTHGVQAAPSAKQGAPERAPAPTHRKVPSGNSITNKVFSTIRHAFQGVADVDPERNRRDTIGKTREAISQLEKAQGAAAQDVKDASASTLQDLKRFQAEKEDDLRRYMVSLGCGPWSTWRPVRLLTRSNSWRTPKHRSTGPDRTRERGRKQKPRSRRSRITRRAAPRLLLEVVGWKLTRLTPCRTTAAVVVHAPSRHTRTKVGR